MIERDLKETKQYKLIQDYIISNNEYLVFIIGSWGSGKSVLISQMKKNNKNETDFDIKNLGDVTTADEAMLQIVPLRWRIIAFFMISASALFLVYYGGLFVFGTNISYKEIIKNNIWKDMIVILFAWIFTNIKGHPFKILNMLYSSLYWLFNKKSSSSKRVLVIDDLERSSLNKSEVYNLVKSIKASCSKVIVILGTSDDQDSSYYERIASKLEAKIFFKESLSDVNFAIIESRTKVKVFSNAAYWMSLIPIREILDVLKNAEADFLNDHDMQLRFIVRNTYKKLIDVLNLAPEDKIAYLKLLIIGEQNRVQIISRNITSIETKDILKSFTDSINEQLVRASVVKFIQASNLQNYDDAGARAQVLSKYFLT